MLVEDPNDAFTDMRDLSDVRRITQAEDTSSFAVPVTKEHLKMLRTKYKLSQVGSNNLIAIGADHW